MSAGDQDTRRGSEHVPFGGYADFNQPPLGVISDICRGSQICGAVLADAFREEIGLLTSFDPVNFTYPTYVRSCTSIWLWDTLIVTMKRGRVFQINVDKTTLRDGMCDSVFQIA